MFDPCNQHIRAIKAFKDYNIDTFLIVVMELKLDEGTKLKWMEFSNDSQATPQHSNLPKFLNLHTQDFESMPSKQKLQATILKSYVAAVEEACEEVCSMNRESHPLASCNLFQDMTRKEKWDVLKRSARFKNCLKFGHMASKCHALQMYKKCHNYHHNLLHVEANLNPKDPKEPGENMKYVAPSK